MKKLLAILGAWLCCAVPSHAVLWTTSFHFRTTWVADGVNPVSDYGQAPLGESRLQWRLLFDSWDSDRPDGIYGTQLFDASEVNFAINFWPSWEDPLDVILPTEPGGAEPGDPFPFQMEILDHEVVRFFVTFGGDFDAAFPPAEGFDGLHWLENNSVGGTMTITTPSRVFPAPDGGATLPLAAFSLLGLTGLRLAKSQQKSLA